MSNFVLGFLACGFIVAGSWRWYEFVKTLRKQKIKAQPTKPWPRVTFDDENHIVSLRARDVLVGSWNAIQRVVYDTAEEKGWHTRDLNDGEQIALMHSELSEALEALRHDNPPDSHIPEFSGAEAELADVVIRIMHYAARKKLNIVGAVVAKIEYNKTRPAMHGGKKF